MRFKIHEIKKVIRQGALLQRGVVPGIINEAISLKKYP